MMEQTLPDQLAVVIDSTEKLTIALSALVSAPPLGAANLNEESIDDQRTAAALISEECGEAQNEILQIILASYIGNRVLAAVKSPTTSLPTEAQLDLLWEKLRRMAEMVQPPDDEQHDDSLVEISDEAPI